MPTVGSPPVLGSDETGLYGLRRRPRGEADELREEDARGDAENDAGGGEEREPEAHRSRRVGRSLARRPAGRPQQHQPDDLDEAEDGERGRRRQARQAIAPTIPSQTPP